MTKRLLIIIFLTIPLWVVGSTFYWTFRNYTPVPTWDMWDGYVYFAVRAAKGDLSAWFYNHNEHRLILPRLFFYADFWLFKGKGIFLLVSTFVIQFVNTVLLYRCAVDGAQYSGYKRLLVAGIIAIGMFSWGQSENFVWAFQVQFVLLYMVSISAFMLFAQAMRQGGGGFSRTTLLAAAVAVCAAGCMANGLLVLPVLAAWAFTLPNRRCLGGVLALLSAVLWACYFGIGYDPSAGKPSVAGILAVPGQAVLYLARFLGSPLSGFSPQAAVFLGFLGGAGIAWLTYKALRGDTALKLKPGFWIALFILGTGLVITLGRVHLGLAQAVSSRYVTPAVIFWSALLPLLWRESSRCWTRRALAVMFATFVAMLVWQQQFARNVPYGRLFTQRYATLSLALQSPDRSIEGELMWDVDYLHLVSKESREHGLTVFSEPWLAEPMRSLGQKLSLESMQLAVCHGAFESLERRSNGGVVAKGWFSGDKEFETYRVYLVSEDDIVVGAGVSGEPRGDVRDFLRGKNLRPAKNPGWRGYVVLPAKGLVRAVLQSEEGVFCRLEKALPMPERLALQEAPMEAGWQPRGRVLHAALTSDSWQSNAYFYGLTDLKPGMVGSFVGGDAYTGALELEVETDDAGDFDLPFLTGPSKEGISVEVSEMDSNAGNKTIGLSGTSHAWWVARYHSSRSGKQRLKLVIRDNGVSFGQWAAVALGPNVFGQ